MTDVGKDLVIKLCNYRGAAEENPDGHMQNASILTMIRPVTENSVREPQSQDLAGASDLTGQAEGAGANFDGVMRALSRDVPFEMSGETQPIVAEEVLDQDMSKDVVSPDGVAGGANSKEEKLPVKIKQHTKVASEPGPLIPLVAQAQVFVPVQQAFKDEAERLGLNPSGGAIERAPDSDVSAGADSDKRPLQFQSKPVLLGDSHEKTDTVSPVLAHVASSNARPEPHPAKDDIRAGAPVSAGFEKSAIADADASFTPSSPLKEPIAPLVQVDGKPALPIDSPENADGASLGVARSAAAETGQKPQPAGEETGAIMSGVAGFKKPAMKNAGSVSSMPFLIERTNTLPRGPHSTAGFMAEPSSVAPQMTNAYIGDAAIKSSDFFKQATASAHGQVLNTEFGALADGTEHSSMPGQKQTSQPVMQAVVPNLERNPDFAPAHTAMVHPSGIEEGTDPAQKAGAEMERATAPLHLGKPETRAALETTPASEGARRDPKATVTAQERGDESYMPGLKAPLEAPPGVNAFQEARALDLGAVGPTSSLAELVADRPFGNDRTLAPLHQTGGPTASEQRLASHVTQQLVAATQSQKSDPVTLTLNPEELGRVHLRFMEDNGKMTVSLNVERPETLDLMRRHIETLTQDLRNIGYREVNIGLGQEGARQGGFGAGNGQPPPTQALSGETEHQPPSEEARGLLPPSARPPDAGIDIRL